MEVKDDFFRDDCIALTRRLEEVEEHIFSVARVVATTQITICHLAYYSSFKPTLIVGDEIRVVIDNGAWFKGSTGLQSRRPRGREA